ncbi:MAG: hypothetical protein V7629_11275 [Motiliproteus sp.]
MPTTSLPKTFTHMQQRHPKLAEAIDNLGMQIKTARSSDYGGASA